MRNDLNLIVGEKYLVVKPFIDHDNIVHNVGESWIYNGTSFLPYEDGLTLHVLKDGVEIIYRFQWREEAQAEVIRNFGDFVKLA
jgi:hypothetical protein